MAISDALRQTFTNNLEKYQNPYRHYQKPLFFFLASILALSISVPVFVSLSIVFPGESGLRPLCKDQRINALPLLSNGSSDENGTIGESYRGAFYLTEQEVVDYYWMVIFVPSIILFLMSSVYLFSGMMVAYSASARHPCLKVVENNYCTSRRGGVRCLSILNIIFALIFSLMAIFLGSSLLTLGSTCSVPLFWCYEITSWSLVTLYAFTAIVLRRKASTINGENESDGDDLGLEMSESVVEVTPEMERRVNEGFKLWMGSSLLSESDDEEDNSGYVEEGHPMLRQSNSRGR